MRLLVDYYKLDETPGDVQSTLEQIREIEPKNSRVISLRDAEKALGFEVPRPKPKGLLERVLPALIRDVAIRAIKSTNRSSRALALFYEFARRTNQLQDMYFENLGSLIIDSYLKGYEELFGAQLIIRNSRVGNLIPLRSKQICLIDDDSISGPELLFRRGYYDFKDFFRYRFGYAALQLLSARNASICVAPSKSVADDMSTYGIKARVIPHGINTDFYRPLDKQPLRAAYGFSRKTVACWVGSTHPIKGLDYVWRLARDFPEVTFVLAFEDNPHMSGRSNVVVTRAHGPDKLRELYNIADFYISTSIYESFGRRPMEAAACGTPLVSLRTGVLSDIETRELGHLVEEWNIAEYREAVKMTLLSRDDLNPRRTVERELNLERWRIQWRRLIRGIERKS